MTREGPRTYRIGVPLDAPARALVLALAIALVPACITGCTRDEPSPFPGIRLGMAPRDVRDRFEQGGLGTWQTRAGTQGDTALEWTATAAASPVASARFEFHNGMLVALRARLPEQATGETVRTSAKTVTLRAPAPDGGTAVTLIARDCPTHREEAETLMKRAGATGSGR